MAKWKTVRWAGNQMTGPAKAIDEEVKRLKKDKVEHTVEDFDFEPEVKAAPTAATNMEVR